MNETQTECACCYTAAPNHETWCPVPAVSDDPTTADANEALCELGRVFFNGRRHPGTEWRIALWRAALIGRHLIQKVKL